MACRHLTITGRVQNVFYRDWMVGEAEALGLTGWVRNRADGSVEAVVSGAPDRVETLVALAREGSPASRVAEVIVNEAADGRYDRFEKRPTE